MDASSISMYLEETWSTIYMTLISSAISYLIGIPLGIGWIEIRQSAFGSPLNPFEGKAMPGLQINLSLFLMAGTLSAVIDPYLGGGQVINPGQGGVRDGTNAVGKRLTHVAEQPV